MLREKLNLTHREEIRSKVNAIDIHLSEFCFPNLYFFRETHDYHIVRGEKTLFVEGMSYDKKRYLMPLYAPSEDNTPCLNDLKKILSEDEYDFIFPIPEEWLCCFPEEDFDNVTNPNDSDYLFLTDKMASYGGKKMQKKRNLKKQFLREFEPEVKELTADNRHDALALLEQWQQAASHMVEVNDYGPCKEAIEELEAFHLRGYVFYADGKAAGFLLGEQLNETTFTIHFAKADIAYKGIYAYMFSQFCELIQDEYTYINMEQDLGKDGLRQTKRSYRPDLMANKYRILLKEPPLMD